MQVYSYILHNFYCIIENMKKGLNKKFICIILAALCCVLLCACTEVKISSGEEKDILIDVDGVQTTKEDAYFTLMETIINYQNDLGTGYFWETPVGSQDMKSYIKESVKDELTKITAGMVLADKKAIYLTDEELNDVKAVAKKAFENVCKYFDASKYGVSEENALHIYQKRELYNKTYDTLTAEAKESITVEDTKVIIVRYALMPANTSSNDANALYQKIKETKDLEKCTNDAGYEYVKDTKLKKGMVNSNFDEVAFLLLDGEISEVVESKDGLYIIECIDDQVIADSTSNYNMAVHAAQDSAFDEVYNEFAKEMHLYFNNSMWNKIDIEKLLK